MTIEQAERANLADELNGALARSVVDGKLDDSEAALRLTRSRLKPEFLAFLRKLVAESNE